MSQTSFLCFPNSPSSSTWFQGRIGSLSGLDVGLLGALSNLKNDCVHDSKTFDLTLTKFSDKTKARILNVSFRGGDIPLICDERNNEIKFTPLRVIFDEEAREIANQLFPEMALKYPNLSIVTALCDCRVSFTMEGSSS
jgi:hypothetical protein